MPIEGNVPVVVGGEVTKVLLVCFVMLDVTSFSGFSFVVCIVFLLASGTIVVVSILSGIWSGRISLMMEYATDVWSSPRRNEDVMSVARVFLNSSFKIPDREFLSSATYSMQRENKIARTYFVKGCSLNDLLSFICMILLFFHINESVDWGNQNEHLQRKVNMLIKALFCARAM